MAARHGRDGATRVVSKYRVYLCGVDSECPGDPDFIHTTIAFGESCVPRDFSMSTGRSKTHKQRKVTSDGLPAGYRFMFDGGCDVAAMLVHALTGSWPGGHWP